MVIALIGWQVNQTASTSNDAAATKRKIVVADIGWAGFAPFYIAEQKGLFGDSIDVEIVKISSI